MLFTRSECGVPNDMAVYMGPRGALPVLSYCSPILILFKLEMGLVERFLPKDDR
jgi:hypothetical protein